MNVEEVIHEYFKSQPDIATDPATLSYDQSLIASGIIDSLAVLDIIEYLEGRFDIMFDPEDLTGENFDSIAAMAALVRSRLGSDP